MVEAVGEIGHAAGQRELDDLPFIVEFSQFLKLRRADAGGAARHAVGVQNRGLFLLIENRAARIKWHRGHLLRGHAGAF